MKVFNYFLVLINDKKGVQWDNLRKMDAPLKNDIKYQNKLIMKKNVRESEIFHDSFSVCLKIFYCFDKL